MEGNVERDRKRRRIRSRQFMDQPSDIRLKIILELPSILDVYALCDVNIEFGKWCKKKKVQEKWYEKHVGPDVRMRDISQMMLQDMLLSGELFASFGNQYSIKLVINRNYGRIQLFEQGGDRVLNIFRELFGTDSIERYGDDESNFYYAIRLPNFSQRPRQSLKYSRHLLLKAFYLMLDSGFQWKTWWRENTQEMTRYRQELTGVPGRALHRRTVNSNLCFSCNAHEARFKCGSCKNASYCSQPCANLHWNTKHKYQCNK